MPNIKDYGPKISSPGPQQSREMNADDFGAAAWRGVDKLAEGGQQFGQMLQKRNEMSDITEAHKKLSEADLKWTTYLKERARTANLDDPSSINLTEEMKGKFEEYFGELGDKFNTPRGKAYFSQGATTLQENMMKTAMATESQLKGEAFSKSYTDSIENYGNALLTDPTFAENRRALSSAFLEEGVASGYISTEQAAKLSAYSDKVLTTSQIKGLIALDATGTRKRIEAGEWDSLIPDADLKAQLIGHARATDSANYTEELRIEAQKERVRKEAQEQTEVSFVKDWQARTLSAKAVMESNLDAAHQQHWLNMIETKSRMPKKSAAGEFDRTLKRIWNGGIYSQRQLEEVYTAGRLSYEDLNLLRRELDGTRTEEGKTFIKQKNQWMKTWEKIATGYNDLTKSGVANSEQKIEELQKDLFQYQRDLEAKKEDPKSAFDPASKNFYGSRVKKPSIQDVISSKAKLFGKQLPATPGTPLVESSVTGMTPEKDLYNKILPLFNGKPENAWGPNGEPPAAGLLDVVDKEVERRVKAQQAKEAAELNSLERIHKTFGDGMSPAKQEYNKLLPNFGGSPNQAFGPNGEMPMGGFNQEALARAHKLSIQDPADQIARAQKEAERQSKMRAKYGEPAIGAVAPSPGGKKIPAKERLLQLSGQKKDSK